MGENEKRVAEVNQLLGEEGRETENRDAEDKEAEEREEEYREE